jgi:hypothetical protein
MAVISGRDGHFLAGPKLVPGGVLIAISGDVDGDGKPEIVVAEGNGQGGYSAYVYDVRGGAYVPNASFSAHGEIGRAALHVGGSDVNRTGYADALAPDPTDPLTPDSGPTRRRS